MIRGWALIFFFLIHLSPLTGQIADPGFAKYLSDKGYYQDLLQLDNMSQGYLNNYQVDSMNFYLGWAGYNLQLLEGGIESFLSVSRESGFFNASRFFASWSKFYLGQPDKGIDYLKEILQGSHAEQELLHMFKTSGALMKRNIHEADSLLGTIKKSDVMYAPQWERMEQHTKRLVDFKPKSYAMAGILSSIVPGAGKIYARQKGAGTSSFLMVGTLAAITIENGYKTGWTRWNTLTAASILTIFYVGNIYGSIVSVRVYRERFFNELDRAILLDINIPLRNIYQ